MTHDSILMIYRYIDPYISFFGKGTSFLELPCFTKIKLVLRNVLSICCIFCLAAGGGVAGLILLGATMAWIPPKRMVRGLGGHGGR